MHIPSAIAQGIPYGEMKTAGAPPRILSPEEIEGMRVVCKVRRPPYLLGTLGHLQISKAALN